MINWDVLKEQMETGVVLVTFRKANGDLREMECTLAEYLLPETTQPSTHQGANTMIVFDIVAEGWRSFRKDRVISVEDLADG